MDNNNHYNILEIPSSADQDTIKKAYKMLSKKYHPDTNPDDRSLNDKFIAISKAYEAINTPQKKRAYDDQLAGRSAHTISTESSKATDEINRIKNIFDDIKF